MKKYELVKEDSISVDGHILYRIQAVRSFSDVKEGEFGGYVESENNLSHAGYCWVYDDSKVYGDASIFDNAKIYNNVRVLDDVEIYGDTKIFDDIEIYGYVSISGSIKIGGKGNIFSI